MSGTRLVSRPPTSALPEADLNWFPFTTTALVSVPVGFVRGWLCTVLSGRRSARRARERYAGPEQLILAGPTRRRPSWSPDGR